MFRQQVRELTDLLRQSPSMAYFRDILATKGLPASKTILAGLIDSEDNSQYGVIITAAQECIVFETAGDDSLIKWETVKDPSTLTDDFGDAASVGLSMLRNGEIS